MTTFSFRLPFTRRLHTALCIAAATAALALTGCKSEPPAPALNGVDISASGFGQDWSMPNATGGTTNLADFKGKVTYVFFGYAQCPDVCPTTMMEMAEVKNLLGEQADQLQTIFVTVDPERDTPEVMRAYLESFDPKAIALIGNAEQVNNMAQSFRVTYEKVAGPSPSSYTMNHTAGGFVYDTQSRMRLYLPYGTAPQAIADDVRALLKEPTQAK
ncbi:SCO family protein [Lampropedia puyangensis]|uniref:SCO family protein n=1 Tax=Lampropedia puyangensis TaxID=1330072 RepID=A0A4S8FCE0_9BURK|nr:SCO family protein [Lampropedia puyangensis]THU04525.1 SCO family protein [Lampropedia puyangensis]